MTEVRKATRSKRTGKPILAQFAAVGDARDKNGRLPDSSSRSFFVTDIRPPQRRGGGDDMPTATKSKSAAKKTTAKRSTAPKKKGTRGQNAARDAEIVKLSKSGKSNAEVGEKFGISANAVHGVLWRAAKKK